MTNLVLKNLEGELENIKTELVTMQLLLRISISISKSTDQHIRRFHHIGIHPI